MFRIIKVSVRHSITYRLDYFLRPFFGTTLSGGGGGDRPLVFRRGWDTIYDYSGKGRGQTVVSQRGKIAFNDCTNNVFIVEV